MMDFIRINIILIILNIMECMVNEFIVEVRKE